MKHHFYVTCIICLLGITLILNGCKNYDVTPHYGSKYIAANTGKVTANVPEAYELGWVVLALTDVAQRDTGLIDVNTSYYKDFTAHFNKFKNHQAVVQLNTLASSPKMLEKFRNGLFAFGIYRGRFALNENYRIDNSKVEFKRYARLLEDFYSDSNFKQFYASHQDTYKQMIQKANTNLSFDGVQKALNKDVKSYHVILSPLMKGLPGVMDIKDTDFSESVIFPYLSPNGLVYGKASTDIIK